MSYDFDGIKARNAERIDAQHFNTRFKHLMRHNGFRKGEIHLLVAEKGSGKSTLVRAWLTEILAQGKKAFLRLSEEASEPYTDELASFFSKDHVGLMNNLAVDSELALSEKEIGYYYKESLRAKLQESSAEIFIFDNFTTSVLGSLAPRAQEQWARDLKQLAISLEIPIIIIAHTAKGYSNMKLATGDDIRGNATLSNMAAYIYTLTVRPDLPNYPSILSVDKARHHNEAHKKKFLMNFSPELRTFKDDKELDLQTLREVLGITERKR